MRASITFPALFDDALSWAVAAYPSQDPAPVSVTADAEAGEVRLAGLDHAQAHAATFSADVRESGHAWIDGRAALALFSNAAAPRVDLSLVHPEESLLIRVPGASATLNTTGGSGRTNFPGPDAQWVDHATVQADVLAATAGAAAWFVDHGSLHDVYDGVHLTTGPAGLTATGGAEGIFATFTTGTDHGGTRPQRIPTGPSYATVTDHALDVVLPARELDRCMRGLLFTGMPVAIATATSTTHSPVGRRDRVWVRLEGLGRVAHLLALDTSYPVMPAAPSLDTVSTAEVSVDELLDAVERLSAPHASDLDIDVHLGRSQITLSATSAAGTAEVAIAAERSGLEASTVRVNARLLRRALVNVTGIVDRLEIRTAGRHAPVVLASVEDDTTFVQLGAMRVAGSVR